MTPERAAADAFVRSVTKTETQANGDKQTADRAREAAKAAIARCHEWDTKAKASKVAADAAMAEWDRLDGIATASEE